jgi:cellulose synthase/poly-beta-1,6-N-acetylglucosamine synthase-like glycosyltransferase
MMIKASDLRLSVIVPAYNGAHVLAEALPALRASDLPHESWELIVVDDASTDDTASVAERFANEVLCLDGAPRGPAYARNCGAQAARADILVFVDADVCVHSDTLRMFLEAFSDDPEVSAVFGAYDVEPRATGLVSQYRNLLHHFVHASEAGEASTFWAGCGAVRRSPFLEAGLFDAKRYPRPQIEDIELGYRLRSLGYRILLRPDIQGTHLKQWTLWGMVLNDVRDRGIPWMRLMLERRDLVERTLNVRTEQRVLAGAAALALLALVAAAILGSGILVGVGVVSILVIVVRDFGIVRWFGRIRGPWIALGVVPLRLLYHLLNAAVASVVLVQHVALRLMGDRAGRSASTSHDGQGVDSVTTLPPCRGNEP